MSGNHVKHEKGSYRFMINCMNIVVLCVMLILPCNASAQTPQQILKEVGITPHPGQSIPLDAVFKDHSSDEISLREALDHHPAVLCLVYFDCPMLCKLSADGLVRAVSEIQEEVGDDFQVIMVSFNPADTPEKANLARQRLIQKYGRSPEGSGWYCLTGSQAEIERLTSAVGFQAHWDETIQQYAHASGLIIVSGEGVITQYLDGVNYVPRELSQAIKAAGDEKVSEKSANSFLTCYLYDPTTGRFGSAVQWTVRILGGLTIVGMLWMMIGLQRQNLSQNDSD